MTPRLQRDIFPAATAADASETAEWLEAFEDVFRTAGPRRCLELLQSLLARGREYGVNVSSALNTPYCNSIPLSRQPPYPGDLEVERRLTAMIRWNALAMVVRANRLSTELGGHLASYASAADLFETGFHHFFRGNRHGEAPAGDLVLFQPHSAPGVYARAYLEGRLTEEQLSNYRRECDGRGLCSYPHPRLMPGFWQFPTGSMGLGAITAVYHARFMRYLENRGLLPASDRKIWAFLGDGEMDEPESLAGLSVASRENLDNLIFVINCNLQRLDGPVRGNGSIVQELERLFTGAGWRVIKVLWGSNWDGLFARDRENLIVRRLSETVDGELQSYAAHDAEFNRERFFNKYPELRELVSDLSDAEIDHLLRGGHDPVKIHAAFAEAAQHDRQPVAILAQTKKGFGLGKWAEGRMSAHQQKKLDDEALAWFRDRFELPLSDEDVRQAKFFRPPDGSPELQYLLERRKQLGGFLPERADAAPTISSPPAVEFGHFAFEPEGREYSTTVAFVRMMANLLRNRSCGRHIVPIVADEARTFGMQSLFRQAGIYSCCGQVYEPEDHDDFLWYKEARDGQILQEGINEAGALSSWIAAGTSYSNHGIPMLPVYIFYSMFGFQRVGDLVWAAADSRARGFLVGATSGRTTLSGEGLQHQDGSSHLVASTIPACRAWDPCFAYELAIIVERGLGEMLERQNDVFYYVTVMNENYPQPAMPAGAEQGITSGMYLLRTSSKSSSSGCVQLLGSGTILREALSAADLLEDESDIAVQVWSVTSFTELRRAGMETDRWNRLHPEGERRRCHLEECLNSTEGPIVAATDYVRAVPDLIRSWIPRRYVTLGTDGFGRSDTRQALRRFFEVDRASIALAALCALADEGTIPRASVSDFIARHECTAGELPPWEDCRRDR